MRLIKAQEQHFTEGEPDLEPPEEFAISELHDVAQLEEGLDNEDVSEEDVDEAVLEETLEDLVHGDDDDDDDGPTSSAGRVVAGDEAFDDRGPDEDVEESLDLILEHRLAILPDDGGGQGAGARQVPEMPVAASGGADQADAVRPCGPGEFTCHSCFLVHSRALLADPVRFICRDCSA